MGFHSIFILTTFAALLIIAQQKSLLVKTKTVATLIETRLLEYTVRYIFVGFQR